MATSQFSFLQNLSLLFAPFFNCKHFGLSGDLNFLGFQKELQLSLQRNTFHPQLQIILPSYHKLFTLKALTSVKFVVVHHHPPGAIKPSMVQHVPRSTQKSKLRSNWPSWDGMGWDGMEWGDDLSQVPKNQLLQRKTYLLQDESHELLQSQDGSNLAWNKPRERSTYSMRVPQSIEQTRL